MSEVDSCTKEKNKEETNRPTPRINVGYLLIILLERASVKDPKIWAASHFPTSSLKHKPYQMPTLKSKVIQVTRKERFNKSSINSMSLKKGSAPK